MLSGLPLHFLLPFFPHGMCTLLLHPWHQPAWLRAEAEHLSIRVQAQTTLSQCSATTPLAGWGRSEGLPTVPVLPHPHWSPPQTCPKQLEQDIGRQEWEIPISGAPFLSSSCAPCRLTGPGNGPQPQSVSHIPHGGLTIGTA